MIDRVATVDPLEPEVLLVGDKTNRGLNDSLVAFVEEKARPGWQLLLGLALLGVLLFAVAIIVTVSVGVGTWGNNIPVAWAFGITNFVWWIGIGHAGTLISAILLLLQQRWRTSINRFAEAMTLFAVMCAGLFPVLHLGRPWFFYWLLPYPATMRVWPQFKSPLIWDVFAVTTYFTVSLLFWYLGLIPDLATMRDTAKTRWRRALYGIFALGWRGSGRHWHHHQIAYLLLAGLATPLVISVHTVVSFDFAVANLPGWHTTIFPPYFVAGAIFSGFAMVLTLVIPARRFLGFQNVITAKHLDNMCKVILATGWIVAYGYLMENFVAWYGGDRYESFAFVNRRLGPYAPAYWLMVTCNVLVPQIFWWRGARQNVRLMWVASLLINVGMWLERFVIIIVSLHRDYLPSSWTMFTPTWVDLSLLIGSICFFGFLFLLFLRYLPSVSLSEVKELHAELQHETRASKEAIR